MYSCSKVDAARDTVQDSLWSFGNRKNLTYETHCHIGVVAGSDATDFSTCAELRSLCETEQTGKGTGPLVMSDLSKYPWQIVGTDLFELKRLNYLLVVDYFSR